MIIGTTALFRAIIYRVRARSLLLARPFELGVGPDQKKNDQKKGYQDSFHGEPPGVEG
jgi:hypothetical protein